MSKPRIWVLEAREYSAAKWSRWYPQRLCDGIPPEDSQWFQYRVVKYERVDGEAG